MTDEPAEPTAARQPGVAPNLGQIVLVLQGGGALGAYQAGVYQAMHEAGIEPDWVIGTSIGAINACIIAGNEPRQRMDRLEAFWRGVSHGAAQQAVATLPVVGPAMATWMTMAQGLGRFFRPNPLAFVSPQIALGAEAAGYYSTQPLEESLRGLVDFGRIDRHATRLTVGAANVRTSEMRYFDSRDMPLTIRHVLASGALPPAFPAIRIDGSLYWDGGILSNTPLEAVFDDYPRRSSLVFAVHLWNPAGSEPDNIWQVQHRQKDLQYSSRTATHIARQQQIHRLRHVIAELGQLLPAADQQREDVQDLTGYGCMTRMHVVRLMAPNLDREDHTKDIDFSPAGIRQRWAAGYADTSRTIAAAPWRGAFDPLEGCILHDM